MYVHPICTRCYRRRRHGRGNCTVTPRRWRYRRRRVTPATPTRRYNKYPTVELYEEGSPAYLCTRMSRPPFGPLGVRAILSICVICYEVRSACALLLDVCRCLFTYEALAIEIDGRRQGYASRWASAVSGRCVLETASGHTYIPVCSKIRHMAAAMPQKQ